MHVIGIAPQEKEKNRRQLLKQGKVAALVFFLVCFLPALVYGLFYFDLVSSKPRFSLSLEQPVALVNAGQGTGTAFLVGETRLLTAKHVVAHLNEGETVGLIFEKAEPPINTSARLLWKEPGSFQEPEYFLYDVAVLELERPTDLPEGFPRLLIGDSDGIMSRDKVIAIGYPGGLMSTTSGTISNDQLKGLEIFQLDVGVWKGSSGGPLIYEDTEEVIGILVAGLSAEFQGINFANKINNVKNLLVNNGINIDE